MKRRIRTRHHERSPGGARIQLFPFLAVLLCTMGALIVVLVLVARQSRAHADSSALRMIATQKKDLDSDLELVRWRTAHRREDQEKVRATLEQARAKLGHIEDHARRLREEGDQLAASLQAAQQGPDPSATSKAQLETALARVEAQAAAAGGERDSAERELAERKPCYAIIPYNGKRPTNRRPLYIECRADAIVLQPEGVTLSADDFQGPLGPGNPLAASLRAKREYLVAQGGVKGPEDEPYPFLIVRPGGVASYYAARTALESWASDFGYELVDEDWHVAMPERDPALVKTIDEALAVARLQQRRLIAAAPREYGPQTRPQFRASGGYGGIVPDADANDSALPAPRGGRSAAFARAQATGGGGAEAYPQRRAGRADSAEDSAAEREVASLYGAPGNTVSAGVAGGATADAGGGEGSAGIAIGDRGANASGNAADANALATSGTFATANSAAAAAPSAVMSTGSPAAAIDAAAPSDSGARSSSKSPQANVFAPRANFQPLVADSTSSPPLRPGEWHDPPPREAYRPAAERYAPTDPRDPRETAQYAAQDSAAGSASGAVSASVSLAKTRGHNWGLPDAARNAVPVVRPMAIACYADRLVLLPDAAGSPPQTIPLPGSTAGSMDALISAAWTRIESWGIAGRGMYWRPLFRVQVMPGGESRFRDLLVLLSDSGVDVERK